MCVCVLVSGAGTCVPVQEVMTQALLISLPSVYEDESRRSLVSTSSGIDT